MSESARHHQYVLVCLVTPELRFLILVGFLGAFTTFSTYSNEGIELLQDARMGAALLYMGGNVILGLCAVWVGQRLAA